MTAGPSLGAMVTAVAGDLMAATRVDSVEVSQRALARLVNQLGIDVGFLRHNDHTLGTTTLVTQWPPREAVPDPDPIGVVRFADADPVFAMAEHLKAAAVVRPGPANELFQQRIRAAVGVEQVSLACVPLLSGDVTTGTLGFVRFGDSGWTAAELNPLQTIATLFAQLQGRITAEEQLGHITDDLTGLLHRRALAAHLEHRLVAGRPGPVAVLYLDVDRLKTVNDYLGHEAGDWFIRVFAERLRREVPAGAVLARVGGDEFVVVPPDAMDAEAVRALARGLQRRLHQHVVIDSQALARTVSIGAAMGIPGVDSTADLLHRADNAAMVAKRNGRSRIALFNDPTALNPLRLGQPADIAAHLDAVLDAAAPTDSAGALEIHYLPEVDMRTGRITAVEALARWRHPVRGLLPPASFVGVAESINKAATLGRLIMRSACADYRRWRSHDPSLQAQLCINVSAVQLLSDSFSDSVAALLDEFEIPAGQLRLEVSERFMRVDAQVAGRTLAAAKSAGMHVALDDFGTGFSGFSQLRALPIDIVKIDRAIVRQSSTEPGDRAVVRAVLALADGLGLQTVAEGVETAHTARTMLALGCRTAQGFLFSRPVGADRLEELLVRGSLPVVQPPG